MMAWILFLLVAIGLMYVDYMINQDDEDEGLPF